MSSELLIRLVIKSASAEPQQSLIDCRYFVMPVVVEFHGAESKVNRSVPKKSIVKSKNLCCRFVVFPSLSQAPYFVICYENKWKARSIILANLQSVKSALFNFSSVGILRYLAIATAYACIGMFFIGEPSSYLKQKTTEFE